MPCLDTNMYNNGCNTQPSFPEIPVSNCDCECSPIQYDSTSFSQSSAEFNVPTYCDKNNIVFTATDFSQQLASGVGREVSFAAFMQMGSSLANAAQAMIVLAMDQCNNVLNQNEALIATPTSSSSTTTTTIYHQTVCPCDNAPTGATDEYIQNWTDSNGVMHQQITFVDASGKEVGKRDYVLDNNNNLTVAFASGGDKQKSGVYAAGDTVTVNGGSTNYILVDTGKTDADGNKIFNLDTIGSDGKASGTSIGSISFNSNGTIDHSAILDYSTISGDSYLSGAQTLTDTGNTGKWSGGVADKMTIGTDSYSRDNTDDIGSYLAYKDNAGNIIYVDMGNRGQGTASNNNVKIYTSAPTGLPDAYSTYETGGKGVTLTQLSSTSGAPVTNSTQTNVTDTTADPLTTMAAVFKYAEVYAEAMTMISTYYQNNIDAYKNRPH